MPDITVSHYTVLEKLGSGGMGVVFKAVDSSLNRPVALKFLPPELSQDAEATERFLREARAASALDHVNICTIHEVGRAEDGQLFICMAYYEGETLAEEISRGPLSVNDAVDLATQIARGLAEAHARGMVHRDIKPANVLVTRSNVAKILDFGLARLRGDSSLTRAGATVGTVAYMAPEQIQGSEADERADLWALGVVLYEMLAGSRPFRGEHDPVVMYEILNADPQPLSLVRTDVPDSLRELLAGLLRKDPSKRISSAQEVIDGLHPAPARRGTPPPERSVAVLYFENMSMEKENDYFCAGIADDIITDLSKIKGLKVLSRTDVLPFKNKEVNTREVGRALHVNYILEGSVRKAGTRVRITAQLVDVGTGFHIWAERFDRMLEDIFDLQNEVSASIAGALRVSLTESEKQSLAQKPTDDLMAHDFYLRGIDFLYRRGKRNTLSAIQMLENAIALDPNYVAAYSGLGTSYSNMYTFYDGDPRWLAKMIEISDRALALDPAAIEARFAVGMAYFHQRRFPEARKTLQAVAAQQPDHYDAHRWLGVTADVTGDYDAALVHYRRCAELKPFSEEPWMQIEMTYRRKGDTAASDEAARRSLDLAEAKLAVNPDDVITLSRIPSYYVRFGQKGKALESLRKVVELDPTDGLALYNCACAYAVIGDRERSLECLKRAFANGYNYVREWVKSDPDFAAFREDPEFKTFVG